MPGNVLIRFFSAVLFYGQRRYTPPANFQTLGLSGLLGTQRGKRNATLLGSIYFLQTRLALTTDSCFPRFQNLFDPVWLPVYAG
jgi:hypothetical protein